MGNAKASALLVSHLGLAERDQGAAEGGAQRDAQDVGELDAAAGDTLGAALGEPRTVTDSVRTPCRCEPAIAQAAMQSGIGDRSGQRTCRRSEARKVKPVATTRRGTGGVDPVLLESTRAAVQPRVSHR
jgi:hypothetical protein